MQEKKSCLHPVPFDRSGSDSEELSDFRFRKACEESHLDNLAKSLVDCIQAIECSVECQDLVEVDLQRSVRAVKRDSLLRSTMFYRLPFSREVHEHLPHRARCRTEEVTAVLPLSAGCWRELEIRLVHELGGRERVAGTGFMQVPMCNPLQLVVYDGIEFFIHWRDYNRRLDWYLLAVRLLRPARGDNRIHRQSQAEISNV